MESTELLRERWLFKNQQERISQANLTSEVAGFIWIRHVTNINRKSYVVAFQCHLNHLIISSEQREREFWKSEIIENVFKFKMLFFQNARSRCSEEILHWFWWRSKATIWRFRFNIVLCLILVPRGGSEVSWLHVKMWFWILTYLANQVRAHIIIAHESVHTGQLLQQLAGGCSLRLSA